MRGAGCADEEASTVARRLVDSNLVGHDSHGVIRVGKYLEWVHAGWIRPNQPPSVVFDSDTMAIIDGNRGFGQVVGEFEQQLQLVLALHFGEVGHHLGQRCGQAAPFDPDRPVARGLRGE